MFNFVFDLGTILNIFLTILYLIIIISFQFVKIGPWGIKRDICMTSEELWHKVHVNASFVTIPFLLISILLIFLNNLWVKIVVGLLLLLILPMIWNIVVKLTTKNKALEIRKQEQPELEAQIKKESY